MASLPGISPGTLPGTTGSPSRVVSCIGTNAVTNSLTWSGGISSAQPPLSERNTTRVLSSRPSRSSVSSTRPMPWSMRSTCAAYTCIRRASHAFSGLSSQAGTRGSRLASSWSSPTMPSLTSRASRSSRSVSQPASKRPSYRATSSSCACSGQCGAV